MLSGHDFAPLPVSTEPLPATGVHFVRPTTFDVWTVPAPAAESRVLDDWLPQRREQRKLQRAIDACGTQVALLDESGEIIAVNRNWRMTADLHGLEAAAAGIGQNYLTVCRNAAAGGCRDAVLVAHGLEGVMEGQWRSFSYKYDWNGPRERRTYALLAWRMVDDRVNYVAVSHELLETRPL
jgi:hypothetical protein